MYQLQDVKVGAAVRIRQWGGAITPGTVETVEADIKCGRPGVTYRLPAGADPEYPTRWAYLDQVAWVGVNLSKV